MKALLSRWLARKAPVDEATPEFEMTLALHTDVGPVREHNEDCIAALNAPAPNGRCDRTTLVALADGMGGHQAGELASRLAVEAAMRSFGVRSQSTDAPMPERLHAALAAANQAVFQQARRGPQWQGMGTTLLLFAPTGQGGFFAWVGDSRLYLWRADGLMQLTRDDTLVRGLVERGLIDVAQAASHPDHSVLTQAVGTHVAIPAPHVHGPVDLAPGDRLLLCSDGVHDVVSDAALGRALQAASPHEAVRAIHALALHNGADDNLSIGVIHIHAPRPALHQARPTRDDIEVPS